MSQQALFEFDPKVPTKVSKFISLKNVFGSYETNSSDCFYVQDEDAYHFIGYMPIDGRLYELDGLREGPIDHGPIAPEQDWLDVVRPIIVSRINV